ncbi:hypothetical protein C2E23DRAFT_851095 [Lenzites betulinus]|nr:hypothetical protein C2E23DRAFT_851095 [Lenzites betulinus]
MSSIPRSQSVPHVGTLKITTDLPGPRTRAKLPRHRSATVVASTHNTQPLASLYSPRSEREDPFSLGGFFPTALGTFEHSAAEQEWDWLHAADDAAAGTHLRGAARSGLVSPISEDDEWEVATPCSAFADAGDARARDAILREDKLGILALSDRLSLVSASRSQQEGQAGDPLDDEAVYDALRALRTAHSRPRGSAVTQEAGGMYGLFSAEKEGDDKMAAETDGTRWGALVSWGVSRVVDYISPV